MKKRQLLLPLCTVLLFSLSSADAQEEFAPIGARWFQNAAIDNIWGTHPLQDFYVIESEKDTLVDGLLHRKVGGYLFYQDGNQVYYRWQDSLRLLYDYGVEEGDTVRFELLYGYTQEQGMVPIQNTYLVETVSFVQADTASLKKVDCRLLQGDECHNPSLPDSVAFSYRYLERLGSVRGVLESIETCGITVPGAVTEWLRCYQDEEVSYQTERFLATAEEGEGCDYRTPTSTRETAPDIPWSVFPNPTSGSLTVDIPAVGGQVHIEILDINGRSVLPTLRTDDNRTEIDLGGLANGLYYVRVVCASFQSVQSFIKM